MLPKFLLKTTKFMNLENMISSKIFKFIKGRLYVFSPARFDCTNEEIIVFAVKRTNFNAFLVHSIYFDYTIKLDFRILSPKRAC